MNSSFKKYYLSIIVLFILFLSSIIFSLYIGQIKFDWIEILSLSDTSSTILFWKIRLPRVILTVFIGSNLAVTGVLIQGLFRNPLVEPGLIGVTTGAALFAYISIVLLSNFQFSYVYSTHFFSFLGALFVSSIVLFVSKQNNHLNTSNLLLTGIGINSISGASIGILSYLASDSQLRVITFWGLGSLAGSNSEIMTFLIPVIFGNFLLLLFIGKYLNLFMLGELEAIHLGLNVNKFKFWIIIYISILVGTSVALSGSIGFVGLVVPHIIRLSIGFDNRFILPSAFFLGSILLLIADTISRSIIPPSELPVGILTSLLGAPIFLILLNNQRKGISE